MALGKSILHRSLNGNVTITLYENGSQTREWPDGELPKPTIPLSIDCKITEACDRETPCPWCHEASTSRGNHADFHQLIRLGAELDHCTELAIGGGNIFCHPQWKKILKTLSAYCTVNLTVPCSELVKHCDDLLLMLAKQYIRGLGVSWDSFTEFTLSYHPWDLPHNNENIVCHFIVGIHEPWNAVQVSSSLKVLLLGYKNVGRGFDFYQEHHEAIDANIRKWRYWLPTLLERGKLVAFDNLALEQLHVRDVVSDDVWQKHYLGADGEFSMYLDMVKMEYARSSTEPPERRYPMNGMSLEEMFARIQP